MFSISRLQSSTGIQRQPDGSCLLTLTIFCLSVNHVTLSFTDFDLETNYMNCSHDAVMILDGNNNQAPVIGVCLCV